MEHFTRHETVILTRTSLGRLAYLAKTGIVVPLVAGQASHRQVQYSWDQILELRTIQQLRRQVSLQMIRKILVFLESNGGDRTLHDKHLIIENGEIDWVQAKPYLGTCIIQIASRANQHVGQLKLLPVPGPADFNPSGVDLVCQPKVVDLKRFRRRTPHPRWP